MFLLGAGGLVVYFAIFIAAIVEGEMVFVAASALVSHGRLDFVGVAAAGAAGAAIGDQFFFYALRGRLRRWFDRYPAIARKGRGLAARVRRHDALAVMAIRFSPGIRVALAAACAYADVPPLKFSLLDSASSIVWATGLLGLVAWAGPRWLPGLGISGWWSAIVPALIVVVMVRLAGRVEENREGNGVS